MEEKKKRNNTEVKNKKLRLSYQKIFNIVSLAFIIACCFYYGGRFTKLYLENKKVEVEEENSLIKIIRENNQDNDNFKIVNGSNYFTNNDKNNYIEYSNMLWRIIKLNSDNSITAISNNSISSLAFGKNIDTVNSNIYKWLNDEDKGILNKSLNNIDKYLQKTESCLDVFDTPNNNPCKNINKDNYFSLLSIHDYLNIGSKDSYLNNSEYFYLNNIDSKNNVWLITDDGKITFNKGDEIFGVKPVITIKSNIDYVSGDGSLNNPYKFEKENGYLGSYIKLGNDIWRIYDINKNTFKLILNDYSNDTSYKYSNNNSYYNDTIYSSVAHYLNNDFLNSLSYKNIIKEGEWYNGEYNNKNNFDYESSLNKTIKSKVGLISIGNIILNNNIETQTMTQLNDKGSSVYVIENNKKTIYRNINKKSKIIPAINIDKSLLTKGKGTKECPFEME